MDDWVSLATNQKIAVRGKDDPVGTIDAGEILIVGKREGLGYIVVAVVDGPHVLATCEMRVEQRSAERTCRRLTDDRQNEYRKQKLEAGPDRHWCSFQIKGPSCLVSTE